jgi:hypothetical protein
VLLLVLLSGGERGSDRGAALAQAETHFLLSCHSGTGFCFMCL